MLYGNPLLSRYSGIPHRVGRATDQSAGEVTVRVPEPDTQPLLDQVTLSRVPCGSRSAAR